VSTVIVTRSSDGIFGLQLDDRPHSNCLGDVLCADLTDALTTLAADTRVKVLVVSGAPDLFCGGASRQMLDRLVAGGASVRDLALPSLLIGFPVPVVAALEGDAIGGGLMLALSCDIVIAAESRRYGLNFTTLGFAPGMGATGLLPSLVGHAMAIEMLLSGKFYKGRELVHRGLFNAVVPHDRVREVASEHAGRIAERPRYVIEIVKQALAEPRLRVLNEALAREHGLQRKCFARSDIAATIAASY